jgi:hypothetical protein
LSLLSSIPGIELLELNVLHSKARCARDFTTFANHNI